MLVDRNETEKIHMIYNIITTNICFERSPPWIVVMKWNEMNEWMKEWMKELVDEMNEWMNEMNAWMNEMITWINEMN